MRRHSSATRPRTRPSPRPSIGERVQLFLSTADAQLSTVVDGLEPDGTLVVREPHDMAGASRTSEPGAQLVVTWTDGYGLHDLDVSLAGLVVDRLPMWRLAPVAEPRTTQRRRFARAADAVRAQVVSATGSWSAVVSDLSEGGARCVGPGGASEPGEPVTLDISIDGADLLLPAVVLDATHELGNTYAVRLEFDNIGNAAEVLRRRVFVQQRRARRSVA